MKKFVGESLHVLADIAFLDPPLTFRVPPPTSCPSPPFRTFCPFSKLPHLPLAPNQKAPLFSPQSTSSPVNAIG
ncbi:hypothetical protein, partial [Rhizobium leguminosarum]|uniref:hypothetical protein n=1 Tax=Rhizobium leguminosarum TaxID=384 RepID=UPI003F976D1E